MSCVYRDVYMFLFLAEYRKLDSVATRGLGDEYKRKANKHFIWSNKHSVHNLVLITDTFIWGNRDLVSNLVLITSTLFGVTSTLFPT